MWELCQIFFSSVFSFCKIKVTINENVSFLDYVCRIRLSDCSKLAINRKNDNDVTIYWHRQSFWHYFVSLVKFSYWSKFYFNTITGSGVMTIYFYNGLARNLEIGNTLVWVLPNIWRLGRVRDTNIGTDISNKILLNAAKCQGYRFYRFCVSKGKLKFSDYCSISSR